MNPRLILVTCLVAVASLAPVPVAGDVADSSQQIRAQQPPVPSGITLQGRLVAADTGQPFRDATVTLQPVTAAPDLPGLDAMAFFPSNGQPVDAEGRFEFTDVPRGSYRILATPLQTAMRYVFAVYPEASPEGPRSFSVSAGQAPPEILIAMPRGAAISGRVVDEHGAPYSQVSITVRESLAAGRTRAPAGAPQLLVARTDDNGSFRLFGLQAGEYIVAAQPPPVPTGLVVGLPRLATHPPTYFPTALAVAEAGKLRVRPGDEVGSVDIVLQRSRLVTVRGVAVDADGSPAPGVQIKLQKPDAAIVSEVPNPFMRTAVDGSFEIRQVAPGDYALTASRYGGAVREFAWTPLSVSTDMDGVLMTLRRAVDVEGQVIFDTPPTGSMVSLRIKPVGGAGASQSPAIQVKDNGAFALEHLFGPVLLRAEGWPGWHVQSVLYGGRDITDEPTELSPGTELRVTLSERLGTLTGAVTNSSGAPVAAAVIVFAEDPAHRHERATTTKVVYTAATGRYAIEGLRAGRYIAVAVPREASSLADATAGYFDLLAGQGTKVTIRDREADTLDLKVFAVR